jgi:stage II sporulation protein P
VLIYHSHTSEAYRTSDKDASKTDRSSDQRTNVCAIGDVIKSELEEKYGIAVIHDKTVHDKPRYSMAYKNSGITLDKYLKTYGDFDLIIDLHRDGVPVTYKNVKTKINGEDVAKFTFAVTQKNPRYAKQKKLIDSMIGTSKKYFQVF